MANLRNDERKQLCAALITLGISEFPTGAELHYYKSFPSFRTKVHAQLNKLQTLLNKLKGVASDSTNAVSLSDSDEAFEWLETFMDDTLEAVESALTEARKDLKGNNTQGSTLQSLSGRRSAASASAASRSGSSAGRPPYASQFSKSNTLRPQLHFEDGVDNSNTPFQPKILHFQDILGAPLRLEESPCHEGRQPQRVITGLPPNGTSKYSHPFADALDTFAYPDWMLQPCDPQAPQDVCSTPCTYVDTVPALMEMAERLAAAREIAVDLENHSYRSFQGFCCLMQLSTRAEDFIVDTLALRSHIGAVLGGVFCDPEVCKVFHGADSDILWLQRDFGVYVVNMFDTGQATRVLNLPANSLAYLLHTYCAVKTDKRLQLADWRVRPLSHDMLEYARTDTHYLLYLADKLKTECIAQGDNVSPSLALSLPHGSHGCSAALSTVLERSRQLCLQTYEKDLFTDTSYVTLYWKWSLNLNPEQLSVFAGLLRWRDQIAREEDESTGYVMPRATVVKLAQNPVGTLQALHSAVGTSCPVVTRRAREVLEVIQAARKASISLPVPPDGTSGLARKHNKVQGHRPQAPGPPEPPATGAPTQSISHLAAPSSQALREATMELPCGFSGLVPKQLPSAIKHRDVGQLDQAVTLSAPTRQTAQGSARSPSLRPKGLQPITKATASGLFVGGGGAQDGLAAELIVHTPGHDGQREPPEVAVICQAANGALGSRIEAGSGIQGDSGGKEDAGQPSGGVAQEGIRARVGGDAGRASEHERTGCVDWRGGGCVGAMDEDGRVHSGTDGADTAAVVKPKMLRSAPKMKASSLAGILTGPKRAVDSVEEGAAKKMRSHGTADKGENAAPDARLTVEQIRAGMRVRFSQPSIVITGVLGDAQPTGRAADEAEAAQEGTPDGTTGGATSAADRSLSADGKRGEVGRQIRELVDSWEEDNEAFGQATLQEELVLADDYLPLSIADRHKLKGRAAPRAATLPPAPPSGSGTGRDQGTTGGQRGTDAAVQQAWLECGLEGDSSSDEDDAEDDATPGISALQQQQDVAMGVRHVAAFDYERAKAQQPGLAFKTGLGKHQEGSILGLTAAHPATEYKEGHLEAGGSTNVQGRGGGRGQQQQKGRSGGRGREGKPWKSFNPYATLQREQARNGIKKGSGGGGTGNKSMSFRR